MPNLVAAWVKPPARTVTEVQLVLHPRADQLTAAAAGQTSPRTAPQSCGIVGWEPVGSEQIPDALPNQIVFYPVSSL
jgi:hypothetical protein